MNGLEIGSCTAAGISIYCTEAVGFTTREVNTAVPETDILNQEQRREL